MHVWVLCHTIHTDCFKSHSRPHSRRSRRDETEEETRAPGPVRRKSSGRKIRKRLASTPRHCTLCSAVSLPRPTRQQPLLPLRLVSTPSPPLAQLPEGWGIKSTAFTQSIVFPFTGYVIKQFRLHTKVTPFKEKNKIKQQIACRRYTVLSCVPRLFPVCPFTRPWFFGFCFLILITNYSFVCLLALWSHSPKLLSMRLVESKQSYGKKLHPSRGCIRI